MGAMTRVGILIPRVSAKTEPRMRHARLTRHVFVTHTAFSSLYRAVVGSLAMLCCFTRSVADTVQIQPIELERVKYQFPHNSKHEGGCRVYRPVQ